MQVFKVFGKTTNFYLFSVFRNPIQMILLYRIFDCLLTSMASVRKSDEKAAFLFVGDFNAHHREWLSSVSTTNYHGLRAFDFSSEVGCEQVVCRPTHSFDDCLDLVFTDTFAVVACNVGIPIGSFDHLCFYYY